MKKTVSLLLVSFFLTMTNAQPVITDSLQQLLQSESEDTSRVLLIEKLSVTYLRSRPDIALLLAQDGLTLSRQVDFKKGEAISLNRIGTVLSSIGNYPRALENFFEALKINETLKNQDGIMRNLGNIADIHANQGDNREALNYYFKEKRIAESVGDKKRLTSTLLSIGDINDKMNSIDSARIYTELAYTLAIRLKDDYFTGIALNNFGNIYSKMKKPANAMKFYRLALYYYEKDEDAEGICEVTLGIAKLISHRDSILYYARKSLITAQQSGYTKYVSEAGQFLTDYYKAKATQQIDSAFAYQQITIDAKDSLFSLEKTREILNLSYTEKARQQKLEDERIEAERERKNNLQFMGIGLVIILLFLFLLLLSRKKTNAKTVELIGLISLLMAFEFISLLIHPFVAKITHHIPVLMMMILVALAAVLVPLHHKMEKLIKENLGHKIRTVPKPPIKSKHTVKQISKPVIPPPEALPSEKK